MTALVDDEADSSVDTAPAATATASSGLDGGSGSVKLNGGQPAPSGGPKFVPWSTFTPRRIAGVVVAWVVVTLVGIGCVISGIGPMLETRDQGDLLRDFRIEIRQKADEAEGLPGIEEVTEAPVVGDPVAIVEITAIDFRQVVVEGVGPQQTRHGPGHVPGTAGPGQPSNSVIVGRHAGFGGPFSQLDELSKGDRIKVVTVQGVTVYEVTEVGERSVRKNREEIYGPSRNDRLTLVTSASNFPFATKEAVVVVAKMENDLPFERTRQGGYITSQDGRKRDSSAVAAVILAVIGYAAAAAAAVLLYRRTRPRSAYLMSAPLLLVAIVLVAESAARLLPAWF